MKEIIVTFYKILCFIIYMLQLIMINYLLRKYLNNNFPKIDLKYCHFDNILERKSYYFHARNRCQAIYFCTVMKCYFLIIICERKK